MTLRDLNARIRALEDAEQLRRDTEAALLRKRLSRGLGGVLDSVMSGKKSGGEQARLVEAAARQLGAHRESVIWFLRTRLQEAARTQQRMMETRLAREMEKNRSVLAKARTSHVVAPAAVHETAANPAKPHPSGGGTGTGLPPREEGNRRIPPDNLTEDQVQMFEKGNQDMLRHLESTLDKVRQVLSRREYLLWLWLRGANHVVGPPRARSSRLPSSRTCSSATWPRSRRTLTSWSPTRSRRPRASARGTRS